jgi:hypothetical protein
MYVSTMIRLRHIPLELRAMSGSHAFLGLWGSARRSDAVVNQDSGSGSRMRCKWHGTRRSPVHALRCDDGGVGLLVAAVERDRRLGGVLQSWKAPT